MRRGVRGGPRPNLTTPTRCGSSDPARYQDRDRSRVRCTRHGWRDEARAAITASVAQTVLTEAQTRRISVHPMSRSRRRRTLHDRGVAASGLRGVPAREASEPTTPVRNVAVSAVASARCCGETRSWRRTRLLRDTAPKANGGTKIGRGSGRSCRGHDELRTGLISTRRSSFRQASRSPRGPRRSAMSAIPLTQTTDKSGLATPFVDGHGACRHPDGVARLVRSALDVFARQVAVHARRRGCGRRRLEHILPVPSARRR